jgi:hypothetical protein
MFNGKWKDAPDSADIMHGDQDVVAASPDASFRGQQASPSAVSPSARPFFDGPTCSDVDSAQVFKGKRRKRMCIVCGFEGRKDTTATTHRIEHKVSLCKRSYPPANVYDCPQSERSC